mmetsp:Transcript_9230/g.13214  ORF Transcript_9230/g.13214 Transcript_9230/m.13214 type:complete len:88 (-) Transcript_9230:408-671(-)
MIQKIHLSVAYLSSSAADWLAPQIYPEKCEKNGKAKLAMKRENKISAIFFQHLNAYREKASALSISFKATSLFFEHTSRVGLSQFIP